MLSSDPEEDLCGKQKTMLPIVTYERQMRVSSTGIYLLENSPIQMTSMVKSRPCAMKWAMILVPRTRYSLAIFQNCVLCLWSKGSNFWPLLQFGTNIHFINCLGLFFGQKNQITRITRAVVGEGDCSPKIVFLGHQGALLEICPLINGKPKVFGNCELIWRF